MYIRYFVASHRCGAVLSCVLVGNAMIGARTTAAAATTRVFDVVGEPTWHYPTFQTSAGHTVFSACVTYSQLLCLALV